MADGLTNGPAATVIMEGCVRDETEAAMALGSDRHFVTAVNLLLACSDDTRLESLLDRRVVHMMKVPVSFDIQHTNKVKGHFTLGTFAYVPSVRRMVNLSNIMIKADDDYNGYNAKCGDNTKNNSAAKLAMDMSLRQHLKLMFPQHDWSEYSYRPRVGRVADEGEAGIEGQRSTDGDVPVAEASCTFHFRQAMDRVKTAFSNKENAKMLETLGNDMLNALDRDAFWGSYTTTCDFLIHISNEDEKGRDSEAISKACGMLTWYFMDKGRRERVCAAFKPLNVTSSSVAEIGHAAQQRLGRLKLTLGEAITFDAAAFMRQSTALARSLQGLDSHRQRGPGDAEDYALKASIAATAQRGQSMKRQADDCQRVVRAADILPINSKLEEESEMLRSATGVDSREMMLLEEVLEERPTHRFDRNVMDVAPKKKAVYSTKPKGDQRKINGIRCASVDVSTGKQVYFLDVRGGEDVWVEEQIVDGDDIQFWQAQIAYDSTRRTQKLCVYGRSKRYVTTEVRHDDGTCTKTKKSVNFRSSVETHHCTQLANRLKNDITDEGILVLCCNGLASNMLIDGQVTMEVLFVWGPKWKKYTSWEVMTLNIGFEPKCRCAVSMKGSVCVHLAGFMKFKLGLKLEDSLIWQVALIEDEVRQIQETAVKSGALEVDGTGKSRFEALRNEAEVTVNRGAHMRTIEAVPQGGVGSTLKKIRASVTATGGKKRAHNILESSKLVCREDTLNTLKSQGGRIGKEVESLMQCSVMVSPIGQNGGMMLSTTKKPRLRKSVKRKNTNAEGQKKDWLRNFPLDEARIYKNWSERKCYGKGCETKIQQNEWFVNIPMINQTFSTGLSSKQNFGFCLSNKEGQCFENAEFHVAGLMKKQRVQIPNSVPIFLRGKQQFTGEDNAELQQKLKPRMAPHLRK